MKAGGLETEGYFQLHREFEVSLHPVPGSGVGEQEWGMQAVVFTGLCHPMAVLGFEFIPDDSFA